MRITACHSLKSFSYSTGIVMLMLLFLLSNQSRAQVTVLTGKSGAQFESKANSSNYSVQGSLLDTPPISGDPEACLGYQSSYAISIPNGTSTYSWSISGGGLIVSGNGTSQVNINWTSTGNYFITAQETTSGGSTLPPAILNITVYNPSTPSVTISTPNNPACSGDPVTFTATPTNEGTSPLYTWFRNGIQEPNPTPGVPQLTFNNLVNGDVIHAVINSSVPCAIPNNIPSPNVVMSVITIVTPPINSPVSIVGGSQIVCEGIPVEYSIPASGATCNWNTSPAGAGTITPSGPGTNKVNINWNASGVYTLSVSETANGCTSTPVDLSVFVNQTNTATIDITPDKNPVCAGIPVTFRADQQWGGNIPLFMWYVNGVPRTTPGTSIFFTYIPVNGDIVHAELMPDALCSFPKPTISASVTQQVTANAVPAVSIATPATSLCPGDPATITATASFGGATPVYSWYKNGILMPNEINPTLTLVPADGDFIFAKMISSLTCASPPLATSPIISFSVKANQVVGLTVNQQPTLCTNDPVTIKANPVNGGTAPVYQWYLNTALVPGQQSQLYTANLNPGDKVYAIVTSSLVGCAVGNPATSAAITVTKPPLLDITKVDTIGESCNLRNGIITITAAGGTGAYQYSVLSIPVWNANPVFDSLDGLIPYNVQVKDANGCIATKGIYFLADKPGPTVSASGHGDYCVGDSITLSATSTSPMTYTWRNPAGVIKSNNDSLSLTNLVTGDAGNYFVIGIDPLGCHDTVWQKINVNILPVVSLGSPNAFCAGTVHKFTPGPGYSAYLWNDGSTDSVYMEKDEGVYWVKATDANGCIASDTAFLIPCYKVYIPNAFSPNRNGINEIFKPILGDLVLHDYAMYIFDRWGKEIFESDNYGIGWDGSIKGQIAEPGVYSYFITYRLVDPLNPTANDLTKLRGTLTLVR